MDVLSIDGVRIEALSACVPALAVVNDEKIAKATGIRCCRRVASGTTVVDLCVLAAKRALAEAAAKPAGFGGGLSVSMGLVDVASDCRLSRLEV